MGKSETHLPIGTICKTFKTTGAKVPGASDIIDLECSLGGTFRSSLGDSSIYLKLKITGLN